MSVFAEQRKFITTHYSAFVTANPLSSAAMLIAGGLFASMFALSALASTKLLPFTAGLYAVWVFLWVVLVMFLSLSISSIDDDDVWIPVSVFGTAALLVPQGICIHVAIASWRKSLADFGVPYTYQTSASWILVLTLIVWTVLQVFIGVAEMQKHSPTSSKGTDSSGADEERITPV